MATALDGEENHIDEKDTGQDLSTLTCSICFGWYGAPRKLPVCSHTFCEDCLCKFVAELKAKETLHEGLRCPVCRQVNPGPEHDQDIIEWAQSLELDTDAAEKVKSHTVEGGMNLCVGCKEAKFATVAVIFCLECYDYLCKNCSDISHRLTALRNHTIVDVDPFKEDPRKNKETTKLMSQYLSCSRHPDKITTLLCKDDNSLCCLSCSAEDSLIGRKLVEIDKHTSKEENDKVADELATKLDKLAILSEAMISSKKATEGENKTCTEKIMTEISKMRAKMNTIFDHLEETIAEKCKALTKKNTLDAQEDSEKLQETVNNVNVSMSVLEACKLHGSPYLQYVILHRLKTKITEYENIVLDIKAECKKHAFDLKVQEVLGGCLEVEPNETEALATIIEREDTVALPDFSGRCLLKHCVIELADTYEVRVQDVDLDPLYTGVVGLPENRIALVDNNNGLCCILDYHKNVIGSCLLSEAKSVKKNRLKQMCRSQPCCIAYLKNQTLVVSQPDSKKLYFLSTTKDFGITYEVITKYKPLALRALRNGDLAISSCEPSAFRILRFSLGYQLEEHVYLDRDENGRVFKGFFFMAVDEDRRHVFQSCHTDRKLYCFDFQGNPKFVYAHSNLKNNLGVDLDGEGNIYLCDSTSSNLHILSPEGRLIRMFTNSLSKPFTMAFMPHSLEFVVTSFDSNECQHFVCKSGREVTF